MADDLVELVARYTRLRRRAFGRVDFHRVELGERLHRHLDMLGRKPDLRREIGDVRIFAELAKYAVENAHDALRCSRVDVAFLARLKGGCASCSPAWPSAGRSTPASAARGH